MKNENKIEEYMIKVPKSFFKVKSYRRKKYDSISVRVLLRCVDYLEIMNKLHVYRFFMVFFLLLIPFSVILSIILQKFYQSLFSVPIALLISGCFTIFPSIIFYLLKQECKVKFVKKISNTSNFHFNNTDNCNFRIFNFKVQKFKIKDKIKQNFSNDIRSVLLKARKKANYYLVFFIFSFSFALFTILFIISYIITVDFFFLSLLIILVLPFIVALIVTYTIYNNLKFPAFCKLG